MSGVVDKEELVGQHDALSEYLDIMLTPTDAMLAEADHDTVAEMAEQGEVDAEAEPVSGVQVEAFAYNPPDASSLKNVMTFKVSGIVVGIPLKNFAGVQTLIEEIDTQAGQPAWCLGSVGDGHESIHVVDTYQLIVPESRQTAEQVMRSPHGRPMLLACQGRVGFLCDETLQVSSVDTDQIVMSTGQTSRAWLAGMIRDQGIAVLDPGYIVSSLQANE